MEKYIDEVFEILKDYRSDEGSPDLGITKNRIRLWIEQFEEPDRVFLLAELKNIFTKLYFSKARVRNFLKSLISKLVTDLKYKSANEFLAEAYFLDLQPENKSQKIMLENLREMLLSDYDFEMKDKPELAVKHFIYLDDILCTGNTLFHDVKDWCDGNYDKDEKYLDAINAGKIDLICAFVFVHEKNFHKKKSEARRKMSDKVFVDNKMYRMITIHNGEMDTTSNLEFMFPLESGQSLVVSEYKDKVVKQVNEYTKKGGYETKEEFYRTAGRPQDEKLFSSPENRIRFENILLEKGIEILNHADTRVVNMRALGFSLPSQKDFGFGTLCFTWRNVANNTPLVFWYAGGGFYPLFVKNHTN